MTKLFASLALIAATLTLAAPAAQAEGHGQSHRPVYCHEFYQPPLSYWYCDHHKPKHHHSAYQPVSYYQPVGV